MVIKKEQVEAVFLNQQSVFNFVLWHMISQGAPAKDGGACVYRSASGTACAVGCLILDDEYRRRIEHRTADEVILKYPNSPKTLREFAQPFVGLLSELQTIHDMFLGTEHFAYKVREVAEKFGLQIQDYPFRYCAQCLKANLTEAFCVYGGEKYYCSEACLYADYTEEEWVDMCEDEHSDCYWTTYDDEDDIEQ